MDLYTADRKCVRIESLSHTSSCVRMSHRGRALMLWLSDCLLSSADWSTVELSEQVGVGGTKERGRPERREANALKLFVFGAQKPSAISPPWQKSCIVFPCKRYLQTVYWDLLERGGLLFRGTAMTCHLQSLIPVLGLCIPFVTLIFSSILILAKTWVAVSPD